MGTMSRVTVRKTRKCSSFGNLIADRIAKGDLHHLSPIGLSVPSRVLMDWVKKPRVSTNLGLQLLVMLFNYLEVVLLIELDDKMC